ncbi:MAG: site-specific integrase [Bryobacteraceae bacterium]
MLRTLLCMEETFYAARQEEAPLLKEREVFLEHLLQQGTSLAAARNVSWQLLNVIRLLRLTRLRDVRVDEIENAAQRWTRQQRSNPNVRSCKHSASFFVYVAKKWLRFAGVLKEPAAPRPRFADEADEFARWMTEERGNAALTARSHQVKTAQFLKWVSERRRSLATVRLRDVDDFLIFKGTSGWSRKSARGYADALRAFFRYAEQRSWCKPGIAGAIISPTLYVHEGLPEGPQWKDVQRLLEGVKRNGAVALRARAVLLFLAVYGLRSGEISRLLLSDFDWRLEMFTVNHSKRGGIQKYPLQREVGEAILEYIRKARPRTSCRNLFLTLKPPYRGIGYSSLWKITSRRIDAAGIRSRRRGPHCLRHACATHLLEQGASLKEIGDLLGHRDFNSTRIYAKVHLQQLRRVADFDLGDLL